MCVRSRRKLFLEPLSRDPYRVPLESLALNYSFSPAIIPNSAATKNHQSP